MVFLLVVIALCFAPVQVFSQTAEIVDTYKATVIASEGVAGSSGRIVIRITAVTTPSEQRRLRAAFQQSAQAGTDLLRTMNKGIVTVEGQQSRQIYAVLERNSADGTELVILAEHLASKLEVWKGIKTDPLSVAVCHIRRTEAGVPRSGEIFPSVKVAETSDGLIDLQSEGTNKVTMIEISRR